MKVFGKLLSILVLLAPMVAAAAEETADNLDNVEFMLRGSGHGPVDSVNMEEQGHRMLCKKITQYCSSDSDCCDSRSGACAKTFGLGRKKCQYF
mmetsp:Transcript_29801/g.49414  ORF Transcript_29801/g.49414 Transcript_29801/m.49414 type:complete len:94 (+) Transcript_29801:327-608(+)|eukprot:CAMPEP_0178753062 /NCGR_PEP_ID=MMETSP0744-20121128/11409_1 /TAXON_ID=913974 /ORGANISM="Nitzschia punctata, Strain CCMP561" /LENGTH=93 /DNA_ID=CAMNT_0020406849 /DNA_START=670 /DNA_END=951 /DNA_ORIENTATION=-